MARSLRVIFCLILIISFFSLPSQAENFRVVTLENPPMEFDAFGKVAGFNVDITQEVFRRMGIKTTVEIYPWSRCLLMMKKGAAQAVIDVAYSEERAKYIQFPKEHIFTCEYYMFKLKDHILTLDENLDNAENLVLGMTQGYYYGDKVEQAVNAHKFKRVEATWTVEQSLVKLLAGRIDILIGEKMTLNFLLKKYFAQQKVDIANEKGTETPLLIASTKTYTGFTQKGVSPDVVEEFSKILRLMRMDGTVDWFMKKYE